MTSTPGWTVKIGDPPLEHLTTHIATLPDGTKVSVVLEGPADLASWQIRVDWDVRESAIHRAALEQGHRLVIW